MDNRGKNPPALGAQTDLFGASWFHKFNFFFGFTTASEEEAQNLPNCRIFTEVSVWNLITVTLFLYMFIIPKMSSTQNPALAFTMKNYLNFDGHIGCYFILFYFLFCPFL